MTEDLSSRPPTKAEYSKCARTAQEISEDVARLELARLLERETDHDHCCIVAVWYWRLGYRSMGIQAYERAVGLKPEATIYLDLAVCYDEVDETRSAHEAMRRFYELALNKDEIEAAEKMLIEKGKNHLIRPQSNGP